MSQVSISSYKDLKFWQTSREVSLMIIKLIKELPSERISWIISDQVLRCGFSIGANIAEGFGRYKGREYSRFIQIALGSARETEYWLELLVDVYPKLTEQINLVLQKNSETIKMLIATLKSLSLKDKTNH